MLRSKNILVVYFSQSGQVEQAVRATLAPLETAAKVHYASLHPTPACPFPWTYRRFLAAFPDAVLGVPGEVRPIEIEESERYDLVVIAYQPWFLSISTPMLSFLESEQGQALLKYRPVITLVACRNMWLSSQTQMKALVRRAEARWVGQIVFPDRAPNLVSLLTVLAYLLTGNSGRLLGLFPPYGVNPADLTHRAPLWGRHVETHLLSGKWEGLQSKLVAAGASPVHPHLMLLEKRARRIFRVYANFIAAHPVGSAARERRLRLLGLLLPMGALLAAPLANVAAYLVRLLRPRHVEAEVRTHLDLSLPKSVPSPKELSK